jgi:pyridoxal 5'-phosphate synthase pdxT subunit
MSRDTQPIVVGVLALQGAFSEHIQLLRQAAESLSTSELFSTEWTFSEVRTPLQLSQSDALIIPGGESTTISLVAASSNLLEPLREFVKYDHSQQFSRWQKAVPNTSLQSRALTMRNRVQRNPTWGTCAGLILLAEAANRTKRGGQELIGGLDVRVNRNHFGRQVDSFVMDLDLPFLSPTCGESTGGNPHPFKAVFIRAPVVEKILPVREGPQVEEESLNGTVIAPSRTPKGAIAKEAVGRPVEIMATLPGRTAALKTKATTARPGGDSGDIIAVRQGNVFGTSFHPELTGDCRIHVWWLGEVRKAVVNRRRLNGSHVDKGQR